MASEARTFVTVNVKNCSGFQQCQCLSTVKITLQRVCARFYNQNSFKQKADNYENN